MNAHNPAVAEEIRGLARQILDLEFTEKKDYADAQILALDIHQAVERMSAELHRANTQAHPLFEGILSLFSPRHA